MQIKKMKKKVILIWILFLIISILIPSITYIYENFSREVETKQYGLEITEEITKNYRITQEIYIPERIQKLELLLANIHSTENKGKIKISLEQENIKIEKVIDVSKVRSHEMNKINLKFSKLKKGKALLIIEGIDGEKGSSVVLYKSSDISLGKLTENNISTGKGIVYKIQYNSLNKTVIMQVFFMLLSTFTFLTIMKLSENEIKNNKKIYFLTSIMIFFLINVKVPLLTFNAEGYSETVHNYLIAGLYGRFLDNFLIPDAGYLPLFPRIIGLFIVKLFNFNLKIPIFLMQNIGIYIISLMGSIFVLKDYRKYGSLLFRLCIAMILGGGVTLTSTVDGYYFFNFSYYGIVALILISLLNFEKLNKKSYILLMIFSFFICISKSHYVVLIPIGILILIIFWKKLNSRKKIYLFLITIASSIEFLYIKFYPNNELIRVKMELEYLDIIQKLIFRSMQYFMFIFFPEVSINFNSGFLNILFLLIWLSMIVFNIYIYIKKRNKESILSIVLVLIIMGVILINILTAFYSNEEILWMRNSEIVVQRHSIFIVISYIILIILMIYNLRFIFIKKFKNKISAKYIKYFQNMMYIILLFTFIIRFSAFDNNKIKEQASNSLKNDEILSDWGKYYKFFNEKDILIPYGPVYFVTRGNVKAYVINNDGLKELTDVGERLGFRIFVINVKTEKTSQLHEIVFEKETNVKYLYAERLRAYNIEKLKIIGYDINDNPILELEQLNRKEKLFIGFKNDEDKKIKKIRFFTTDGKEAYVKSEIYLGIKS